MNVIEAIEANQVDLSGFTSDQKKTILCLCKLAFRHGYIVKSNEIINKENKKQCLTSH